MIYIPKINILDCLYLYLRLDLGQTVLCGLQLSISGSQCLPLWLHITEHLIEPHDVDDPGTQTGSSERFGSNKLRIKLATVKVGSHRSQVGISDVFLVKVDVRVKKLVNL